MKVHRRDAATGRASICRRFDHDDECTDVLADVTCIACLHVATGPSAIVRDHARAIDRRLKFRGRKFR